MKDPLSLESYSVESDLQELLIANVVHEGVHFEFKEDYTGDVKNKLGKHVAAFANSHGGLLGIGIRATDGVAADLTGINASAQGFGDSVSQKIASKVRPVPQFATKLVSLNNKRDVLLIRVAESANPPHLFDGMIYVRNAAASDPVLADNRAEIDRIYQKAAHINERLDQAIRETWFGSLNWPNPTAHFIACPLVLMDDLVPDYDQQTIKMIYSIAERIPCGRNVYVASNEYPAKDDSDDSKLRVTRYGLVEYLAEAAKPEDPTVFWTISLESDIHHFLRAVTEFYRSLRFSGAFKLILAFRQIAGKATTFTMMDIGSMVKRQSYKCERKTFNVSREVSMGGENDVLDDASRKQIAEAMIREYVAQFGVGQEHHCDAITNLVYLDGKAAVWR